MRSFQEAIDYDLSSIATYNRLPATLQDIVEGYGSANTAYETLGRPGLRALLADTSAESFHTLAASRQQLDQQGAAIILHGTGVEKVDDQTAQLLSIALGSVYGTPTRTDRRLSQIAWPIKYDPDTTVVRTFSQSLGEAEFHTDTQYFEKPEASFGLFCIESDIPGKGTNQLVHVRDIVAALHDQNDHTALKALTAPYPFRVPSVFTVSGQDDDIEITWAPILSKNNNRIRYRKDTIERALAVDGIVITDEQHAALQQLETVIGTLPPLEHHLQPGEALIVNNTKSLHARTSFDDPQRFLYRVRMKDEA